MINNFFDGIGATCITVVTMFAMLQIFNGVSNRIEFEEAKVKSAISHGGNLHSRCTCMLRRCYKKKKAGMNRPTSVVFLGHILSNLLDSVGGDGLPQDQVDLLLSRHSIFRRDLMTIMKSIVLHWLDERYDSVVHLAESSANSNFIKSLPGVSFRRRIKLLKCDIVLISLVLVIWYAVFIVAFAYAPITTFMDGNLLAIYIPRIPVAYQLIILSFRYIVACFPKCRRLLIQFVRLLKTDKISIGRLTTVPLIVSRQGRKCGACGVILANTYALSVMLINFMLTVLKLVIRLFLHYPHAIFKHKTETRGMVYSWASWYIEIIINGYFSS